MVLKPLKADIITCGFLLRGCFSEEKNIGSKKVVLKKGSASSVFIIP